MKKTYELTYGNPMSGERCRITELEGNDQTGYYWGYLDKRQRQWRLYPRKREGGNPIAAKTVEESAVKDARRPEPKKEKTAAQTVRMKEKKADVVQIKLI